MSYRLIMTIMSGVLETYVHDLEKCIGRSARFFSMFETRVHRKAVGDAVVTPEPFRQRGRIRRRMTHNVLEPSPIERRGSKS
jgi:hypothetical protein